MHSCLGYIYTCISKSHIIPESHPTTGPVRFLAPIRFLVRNTEWSARRNFTPVLFSWPHQPTGPVRLGTAGHVWFDRIIRRTPHGHRAMPVRASYGPRTGISNVFHFVRGPCGTLTDTLGNWHTQNLQKSRTASYEGVPGPYGPCTCCARSVYDILTHT